MAEGHVASRKNNRTSARAYGRLRYSWGEPDGVADLGGRRPPEGGGGHPVLLGRTATNSVQARPVEIVPASDGTGRDVAPTLAELRDYVYGHRDGHDREKRPIGR